MLPVRGLVSPVRYLDPDLLRLARWVSERHVAPLAAVLDRMTPPRTKAEEAAVAIDGTSHPVAAPPPDVRGGPLADYREGRHLLAAVGGGGRPAAFLLRPAPEDEAGAAVQAVARCLAAGRRALVLVPEADPVPATAAAIMETFGEAAVLHLGGSPRLRYRTWLAIQAGTYDVVIATRPGVFLPVPDLGLLYVSREGHPAFREDRTPYHHVREVALARGRIQGASVVLAGPAPSLEATSLSLPEVVPPGRRWPAVEVVKPGPEGRAPRLVRALRQARRAFVFSPVPGYGVAAVCRSCGAPAACAECGGVLRSAEGSVRCIVCEAPGRCGVCGAARFGLRRGGEERVEEWVRDVAEVPVHRLGPQEPARAPGSEEILVGGPDDVRDLGALDLDMVAILDVDLVERRPGLTARERAVTTWMEAIAWARPHGRAIVQAARVNDPIVQALVRGNPARFHAEEAGRRAAAGFPVGSPVFRVAGDAELPGRLEALGPVSLLVTGTAGATVCLLALAPEAVGEFGRLARALADAGTLTRVEAEPHL
jgi:primosomal protein N' (replication factor Y)